MIFLRFLLISLTLSSGVILAAEPISNTPSGQASSVNTQQKLKGPQSGPVVGSMLEDGREVPARFRGVETKEQKARHQQQEQEPQGSEGK